MLPNVCASIHVRTSVVTLAAVELGTHTHQCDRSAWLLRILELKVETEVLASRISFSVKFGSKDEAIAVVNRDSITSQLTSQCDMKH